MNTTYEQLPSQRAMKLDQAVVDHLHLDAANTTVSRTGGGCSSASAAQISTKLSDGTEKRFFMKTATGPAGKVMVQEDASLKAIHAVVPTLCPQSFGWGSLSSPSSASTYFIVVDFLDPSSPPSPPRRNPGHDHDHDPFHQLPRKSLAEKLAQLHTTPAPVPEGYSTPQFGFPVTTCCGDTPQDNSYKSSWASFYAENRLRFIMQRAEAGNGQDSELRRLVERTISHVVPRLIGDEHLNNGKGVTPVVVHGDLWSGNAGRGSLAGRRVEEVIYDPSSFYGHSEYELGIMRMFGGFGGRFLEEYHRLCPKTEPVGEYEDRVALYEFSPTKITPNKKIKNKKNLIQVSRFLRTRSHPIHPYHHTTTRLELLSSHQRHLQHPTINPTHVIGPPHHIAFSTSTCLKIHSNSNNSNNQTPNNHHNPGAKPTSLLLSPSSSLVSSKSTSKSTSTTKRTMSSDDAYIAFLDKANEDPSKNIATTQQHGPGEHLQTKATDPSQSVPTALSDVEMYYTSDTDEAFEPVALDWSGAAEGQWPSVDKFKALILPSSHTFSASAAAEAEDMQISILSPSSFDPNNHYTTVLHAVKTAANSGGSSSERDLEKVEVKVYRVQMGQTRVEYWVVALDSGAGGGQGRIVGMRAKAIES
ncbi:hypothetical protein ACJ72_00286 [Emergomyces africanus]|uniref:protein-ribulosamine 3-kinase n=1 Tax=Emergomyces africanus TaxID=1955775 RepID=A0A1B7P8I6_9EURO|nr:hypothetical protein ACJ72_00286 [Emergomyces africanus]